MVAQIYCGSSEAEDFPTIVTCMSKNEQEKYCEEVSEREKIRNI